jgi:vitamin B12 transporter
MKCFVTSLLIFIAFSAKAQVNVTGKLVDNKNRPVVGASVNIKNSYDGTTSDSLGNYSFNTTEKGEQLIEVTIIGYKTIEEKINISGKPIVLNLALKEEITEMRAVIISAGSFEASDKKKGAVLTDIDIVTTPSANGDITSALKSLPGTQQVGESEGLFVRGGSATESKIYMDGNLVNNFFYSSTPGIATRGRFNPFLFKGTIFSTGGYSALYGQALSAALVLESKDLPERTEADLGISVVGVGGGIQKLAKNKKSSWGVSYNYTNLWLAFNVIKQKQDFYRVPVVNQGDANFRIRTKNGIIKYYGYVSGNLTAFRKPDIDSAALKNQFSLRNLNTFQNLSWRENIGNGWKMMNSVSFSTNKDDISNELVDANNQKQVITSPIFYALKNFDLHTKAWYAQARSVFEKKLKGLSAVRFGADYFHSDERSAYTLFNGTKFSETVKDDLFAAFAETDIYLTNDLAAKIGSRVEHSAIVNKWNVAPRVSLAYKFRDNSQASFAYGLFYQNPERKYLPMSNSLDYSRSAHYILQYQKISSQRTFRTELFYKKYSDLYQTAVSPGTGRELANNNNGYGYAKGIEVFWRDKKTIKEVDYWVSYSYLDTKRQYLNYPVSIVPPFAAEHTASFVFKKFVTNWKTQFNLSYNFASGRPYYRINYDNGLNKYIISDKGKTINYNSTSFSVNYLPGIGKKNPKVFAVWVLGVNNVFGQNQVFSYDYSNDGKRKEPVTPTSKRFVFIGCFLSFGVDRTQDAINNNL